MPDREHHRSQKKKFTLLLVPDEDAAGPNEIPDWAQLPLDQVLNEELSQHLKAAILSLPEKYRVIVILRDVEGFSTAETSQILELKRSNVKVRLHRARLFLRDQLKLQLLLLLE